MSLSKWMEDFGAKKLNQIIMPGAHDAGIAKGHVDLTMIGSNSNTATQDKTIWQQLQCGTRFFDVRLKSKGSGSNKKVVAFHMTAGQGGTSSDGFDETLGRISDWCYVNRGELVILRISHTKSNTQADAIVRNSVHEDVLNKTAGNLCLKTLDEIKQNGNLIVAFAKWEDGGSVNINQGQGIHSFSKYKPGATGDDNGIMCCGFYKGVHDIGTVISTGLGGQAEHSNHHGAGPNCNHLWQLYWQKTYTNPWHGTGIEDGSRKAMKFGDDGKVHGGTHATLGYMINLMKGSVKMDGQYKWGEKTKKKHLWSSKTVTRHKGTYISEAAKSYMMPNIISYDFVDDDVNRQIIALNAQGAMV